MFLITVLCNFFISLAALSNADISKIVPGDYNKDIPPEGITEVEVTILVIKITEISTKTMEMMAEVSLAITWTDHRLNWTNVADLECESCLHMTSKNLWFPKIIFSNCKECGEFLFSRDVDKFYFLKKQNKIVAAVQNVRIKFGCIFNFQYYPFDTLNCTISLISFLYEKKEVDFRARSQFNNSKIPNYVFTPPGFYMTKIFCFDSNYTFSILDLNITTFNLNYVLNFRRLSQKFIFVVFVPSMLIVIISWISFWLEITATAPRVSLELTVVLTLITHISSTQKNLPNVDTMTTIDVWMSFCLLSVFCSLIEVAVVNYCHYNFDVSKVSMSDAVYAKRKVFHVKRGQDQKNEQKKIKRTPIARKIDSVSRVIFPLFFIGFNIYFWWYYVVL